MLQRESTLDIKYGTCLGFGGIRMTRLGLLGVWGQVCSQAGFAFSRRGTMFLGYLLTRRQLVLHAQFALVLTAII